MESEEPNEQTEVNHLGRQKEARDGRFVSKTGIQPEEAGGCEGM